MQTRDPLSSLRIPDLMSDVSHPDALTRDVRSPAGANIAAALPEFSLTDSAEEITLHMAHRIEDKLHSERKVRGEKQTIGIEIETLLSYMDQAREDDAQARLEELASRILSGNVDPRTEIANFAKRMSVQYLAYHYVLQRGRQQNASEEILSDLGDALADLEQRAGRSIRADINTIDAAASYGKTANEITHFQAAYENVVRLEVAQNRVEAVLGDATLAKTLSLALQSFGTKRIADGLKALTSALGLDLSATRSSVSKPWLHALLSNMFHVQSAVSVLENCRNLGARLSKEVQAGFDEEKLMKKIVETVESSSLWPQTFSSMPTEFGVASLAERLTFLDGVRGIVRDLPVQLFVSDDARTNVLEAVQIAYEEAVQEEL
ncbi:TyeA family type III secretion system gatekeeper subunit [Bordetella sp. 02P26C-1]|nr:TyeA family type III secretion system gatekeeper subunit [Bordetella sp. 02P26C-1]